MTNRLSSAPRTPLPVQPLCLRNGDAQRLGVGVPVTAALGADAGGDHEGDPQQLHEARDLLQHDGPTIMAIAGSRAMACRRRGR